MVSREEIIGRWYPPPGGHITEYLDLRPDGTATLETVTLSQEAEDAFRWSLSDSGEEICFHAVEKERCYSEWLDNTFKVEMRQEKAPRGAMIEILILRRWHEAEILRAGGREIKFEEGWSERQFRRDQSC